MNNDVFPENEPRYSRLAKPRAKTDKTTNLNAFKVKPGALSYQITDSLNKLALPKRKPTAQFLDLPSSSSRNVSSNPTKHGYRKLINSNEQFKEAEESKKKKFLLDTYARIAASRDRRCSKRLMELAKPKQCPSSAQNEQFENIDTYFGTTKYNSKFSGGSTRKKRK